MDGVSDAEDQLEIGMSDISCPRDTESRQRIIVHGASRDGGVVGLLNSGMYGFRDANKNRMRDWQCLLLAQGYAIDDDNDHDNTH